MKVNSLVLFRESEHVITDVGLVGENPPLADGFYYSHEQCFKVHSVISGKKCDLGCWVPERLLVDTGNLLAHEEVVQEVHQETIGSMVREALASGGLSIGEIHSITRKPSAAIHSFLNSALRRGEVVKGIDEKWSLSNY